MTTERPSRRVFCRAMVGWGALAAAGPGQAQSTKATRSAGESAAQAARARRLARVERWGYQLRHIVLSELAATPTDLLVVDHGFSDGLTFVRQWSPEEIALLKTKPDGSRRLVLAYLSIGEAERYRFYWKPAWFQSATRPAWLGDVNPRWAGNYPADFWAPDWQRLIVGGPDSYVSRIVAQGFDGVYLDRADVFQELLLRHPQGARSMAAFIARVAIDVRAGDPSRLVIMQNAEELIAERLARDAIDGIAKEDLYFGLDHTEAANERDQIVHSERDLLRAKAAGKRIFAVEYVGEASKQAEVRRRCARNGFLPLFVHRLLGSYVHDASSLSPTYRGPLVPQENQDL